ncbi:hypothetical protein swp_3970 [Shewanella piezotolerans WP3]|uniref:Uncharacterized protein n=1 Tax=Shewanella piezotolerans (strain WP3 / JCM 13877) TaxID=225849 RepID=B8CSL4_SHEPW|nr:hypothetical protein [Shewanella piezotolerans]ACJ30640.1 hypothetical protein swp_3970 [Shewanella piezotolerans WP3]
MKFTIIVFLVLLSLPAFAGKYSGCEDPQYKAYVAKRLAFYEKSYKEHYDKALNELDDSPYENMGLSEKRRFLNSNIVLSARFDSKEVALKNINRIELIQEDMPFYIKSGDIPHLVNIARGWIALNEGDEEAAIGYLLDSTNTNGSPVLGSFGPDKTLIRVLYQQGHNDAVLEYLKSSELFWNTESAKSYIEVWRKMIKNNCAIQFQFYDTTSIKELGL